MPKNKKLHVYYDGFDYVIGWSKEDASAVWKSWTDDNHSDSEYPWERLPGNKEIGVGYMEKNDLPAAIIGKEKRIEFHKDQEFQYRVWATCAAWCEAVGRGWLCTENW